MSGNSHNGQENSLQKPRDQDDSVQHSKFLFVSPGEMVERIEALDWSKTCLGPIEHWSQALRTTVRIVLASRFPHILWWGPQYVTIYNDAYRPILGKKHPDEALGKPGSECWSEIWHIIGPLIDQPFHGGPPSWDEDLCLEIRRHGFTEESHFTIAYSPVPDEEAPGEIGGVLGTIHEITETVIGERRIVLLRDLGAHSGEPKTASEACAVVAAVLAAHNRDIPFMLLYLIDSDKRHARLAGSAGVLPDSRISPSVIDLDDLDYSGWPIREAVESKTIQIVEGLTDRFEAVPPGPWSEPPHTAAVLPIFSSRPDELAAVMIAGLSCRLKFDAHYGDFLNLLAMQVAATIASARSYEEERKRAEALAEIDRAKTLFFSNVSHEFRTPLTLMLGPLEDTLESARVPAEEREKLNVAHRNSLRLLKLVNSLLDFSRIEAGRAQAAYEPVDLAAFTAELASNFRSACERAGLRLVTDCPPLREPVYVDRDMWEKIVLNLLSNAFKFTFEGEIAVRLRAIEDRAELTMSDTGVGIAEHELPRLFERFHRIEGQKSRTFEGSGIGLALVQELVKLHGGTIGVESAAGKGTTFTVSIPFGTAHLPQDRIGAERTLAPTSVRADAYVEEALGWLGDEPAAITAQAEVPEAADLPTLRDMSSVLVVDDNADMRAYVRHLLEPHCEVRTAADGEAALAKIRDRRPDLVLSDVMMPRLDGLGLLRAIRGDPELRDIGVIMLSARAGEESRVHGLEAGADDYLVKPFSGRELLARVECNLKLARLRRESSLALAQNERDANRRKDEFLAMLAHELRNPLAALQNALELMERLRLAGAQAGGAFEIAKRQSDQLSRLVNDLLDVARITRGHIELHQTEVDVASIVSDAVDSVLPLVRARNHRLTVESSNSSLSVRGDPVRLVQCVTNLLNNAAKYTPPGGLIFLRVSEEDGLVKVEVEDNGAGIPPDELPHVFDLFVQGGRSLDRSEAGLGIGLSLVKRLIEMHGGQVKAMSRGVGQGASFTLSLPAIKRSQPQASETAAADGPARRVLIVDDARDTADSLAMLLELEKHQVQKVYDGQDALAIAPRFRPEVVLLDLGLPQMDGYEVARRMRKMPELSETRLVAVSGYGQPEDKQRAYDAGFDAHLVKPTSLDEIKQILANLS